MLDPKILRDDPERILTMLRKRGYDENKEVNALKELLNCRFQLIPSIESAERAINEYSRQISEAKKQNKNWEHLLSGIAENKKLKKSHERNYIFFILQYIFKIQGVEGISPLLEEYMKETKEYELILQLTKEPNNFLENLGKEYQNSAEYDGIPKKTEELIFSKAVGVLPNLIDEEVLKNDPVKNKIIPEKESKAKKPQFNFQVKDHVDLSESLELVDLVRAAKVSGSRFYYLRNDLVKLNQALIHFALDFLEKEEYSLVQPPYLINRQSMSGATIAEDFEDVIYKIEDDDLYLIGTSEHAIAAMHSNEIIEGGKLPLRYAGISPCFRKEAGAHGKDQKGIFRVHQFEKVEQFVFTKPNESKKEHERMLDISRRFYDELKIPYEVYLLSSQDMGKVSAKTYDIEAWMPSQEKHREIVSCSNCWDYQARRLKIRFRDRTNDPTEYLHTLNSTLVATTRVMVSIMENFQNKDGHFEIPEVLQSYMGGQKFI